MPSTVILSFDYDEARNELTVRFTTGQTYIYSLVPPRLVAGFRDAASKGEFFNRHIRDSFRFSKIGEGGPPLQASLRQSTKR